MILISKIEPFAEIAKINYDRHFRNNSNYISNNIILMEIL